MLKALAESPGSLVASALAGSWRRSPTKLECTASELEEIAPLLQSSGAAALCWWRIQPSDLLRETPAAKGFRQAYRLNILQDALTQQTIKKTLALLRSADIEPLLVKGWAAARAYPEQGLRPYGDIDLCVRAEQFAAAENALKDLKERFEVDLHRGFEKFGGGSVDEIYARSQLVTFGDVEVRVPSAEDHLRILSIHMLREGAWRPLWLCDIAVAVETRASSFDWDRCLTADRRRADWVICAISLAHQLLGASVRDTPAARRSRPLPRWLVPAILKEWGSPLPSMRQRHITPMARILRRRKGVLAGLRDRWPNPIEATVGMGGPFNGLPRLPFQIGNCLARTVKFAGRLPKALRQG
ncbi:MAG TPA: nucleotidyltransferase family protein [Pyrinomonadaceae bacterium]